MCALGADCEYFYGLPALHPQTFILYICESFPTAAANVDKTSNICSRYNQTQVLVGWLGLISFCYMCSACASYILQCIIHMRFITSENNVNV